MNNKHIKLNMLLNSLKTIIGIVFPLITFPYVSKILGVDNIGKYNFSHSVITYATMIADLGVGTYAIRECSKARNDSVLLEKIASEIFTINIISTIMSYVLLAVCVFNISKFRDYRLVIAVLSLTIICKTIGTEWIFSVFEDYFYITVRTLFFQILSLILLFSFVKTRDDLIIYTIITVIATSGAGILNYFFARKYCKIKLTRHPNIASHLFPILVIFGMNATVTIYVAADTTILGFMCNDTVTGRYYVSSKIYTIVKTVLSAVLTVSIPRLALLWGKSDRLNFRLLLSDIYKTLLSFTMPAVVGLIALSKEIILLLSSQEFTGAETSLSLLGIALFFCMGAWFWGQCVLVVTNKEKTVFYITVLSAAVNIILNIILIPNWQENAAAFTTIVAEVIAYILCLYYGRKIVSDLKLVKCIGKITVGCIFAFLVCVLIKTFIADEFLRLVVAVVGSVVAYTLVELLMHNEAVYDVYMGVRRKIKGKRIQNG